MADEGAPVEGVGLLQSNLELGFAQCGCARIPGKELFVEPHHEQLGLHICTFHRLMMTVWAPASTKARLKPSTPSPVRVSPRPVSQAERTASLQPRRSSATTSSAATNGLGPCRRSCQALAPAKASPDRSIGFSRMGGGASGRSQSRSSSDLGGHLLDCFGSSRLRG